MGISYPAPQQACYGEITPQQYEALIAKLRADKDASAITQGGYSGAVTYQKIDFAWTYDPTQCELLLTIVGDHNWKAKLAGNQAIFGTIYDQLIQPL